MPLAPAFSQSSHSSQGQARFNWSATFDCLRLLGDWHSVFGSGVWSASFLVFSRFSRKKNRFF